MDEFELMDQELVWDRSSTWYSTLMESLRKYDALKGKLSSDGYLQMLQNLCEVQDNVSKLYQYSSSYTDLQVDCMKQCLNLLERGVGYDSELQNIFERTSFKLRRFLLKIGKDKSGNGKHEQIEYPKDKLFQYKVERLDTILRDVSADLSTQSKLELSRRTEKKLPQKSLAELSLDKERQIQRKTELASNLIIISYFKKKLHL